MSDWVDTHDIGMDGVPDDFDSVADYGDGADLGGAGDDLGGALGDADAWIVDLDLGGLADVIDVAVVAGVDDLVVGDPAAPTGTPGDRAGVDLGAPLLAHDLTDVPDGSDPFAALAGRRLDDAELRNEIRHLRVRSPFGTTADEGRELEPG